MGETITRQEMLREVADRLDADPELVAGAAEAGRPARAGAAAGAAPPGTPAAQPRPPRRRQATREEQREYKMLALCMAAPKLGAAVPGPAQRRSTSPRRCWRRRSSGCASTSPIRWRVSATTTRSSTTRSSRLQALEHEPATEQNLEFRWRCSSGTGCSASCAGGGEGDRPSGRAAARARPAEATRSPRQRLSADAVRTGPRRASFASAER